MSYNYDVFPMPYPWAFETSEVLSPVLFKLSNPYISFLCSFLHALQYIRRSSYIETACWLCPAELCSALKKLLLHGSRGGRGGAALVYTPGSSCILLCA